MHIKQQIVAFTQDITDHINQRKEGRENNGEYRRVYLMQIERDLHIAYVVSQNTKVFCTDFTEQANALDEREITMHFSDYFTDNITVTL